MLRQQPNSFRVSFDGLAVRNRLEEHDTSIFLARSQLRIVPATNAFFKSRVSAETGNFWGIMSVLGRGIEGSQPKL